MNGSRSVLAAAGGTTGGLPERCADPRSPCATVDAPSGLDRPATTAVPLSSTLAAAGTR